MSSDIMKFREVNQDYPVTIDASDQTIQMSVKDVLRWIEPNAPPQDAFRFLLACRTARLNPFLGEAFLVNMGGKWATIISKAGYLKRAQQNQDYDGHECGIIVQQLDAKTKARGEIRDITGTMLPAGWIVIGGWAKVYRKGVGRPFHVRLSMAEYDKGTGTWKTIPCTMIRKTALVNAIREAFAIGDSYDQAEVDGVPPNRRRLIEEAPVPPVAEFDYSASEDAALPPDMLGRLRDLIARAGISDYQVRSALAKRGVTSLGELSPVAAQEIIVKLEGMAHPVVDEVMENIQDAPAPPDNASPDHDPADDFVIPDVPRRGTPEPSANP